MIGLTPARVLQEAGHDITIYAHHFPPATTSNVAAAIWWPDCAIDEALLTPVYRQRALRWQGRSIYWMSRSDALILGGSKEVGEERELPCEHEIEAIWQAHQSWLAAGGAGLPLPTLRTEDMLAVSAGLVLNGAQVYAWN